MPTQRFKRHKCLLGAEQGLDAGGGEGVYFPKASLNKTRTKDAGTSGRSQKAKTKPLPTARTADWQVTKKIIRQGRVALKALKGGGLLPGRLGRNSGEQQQDVSGTEASGCRFGLLATGPNQQNLPQLQREKKQEVRRQRI